MLPAAELAAPLGHLNAEAVYIADEPTTADGFEQGPVTADLVKRLIEHLDPTTLEAMVCGPAPMTTIVTDALVDGGTPDANIRYERFDYRGGTASGKDRRMTCRLWLGVAMMLAAALAFCLR